LLRVVTWDKTEAFMHAYNNLSEEFCIKIYLNYKYILPIFILNIIQLHPVVNDKSTNLKLLLLFFLLFYDFDYSYMVIWTLDIKSCSQLSNNL